MMRLLVLALFTLAAQVDAAKMSDEAQCGVYATDAALEIPDTVVYGVMAAQRCMGGAKDTKKCAIDASGLIESLMKSINSILKATQHCSHGTKLSTASAQCGMEASTIIEDAASLSGAVSGLATYCSAETAGLTPNVFLSDNMMNSMGHCGISGTDTVKSLLMIGMRAKQTADECNGNGKQCTGRALQLTGSLAELTEYMLTAAAHCNSVADNLPALCASKAIKLAKAFGGIGMAAKSMEKTCSGSGGLGRLYLEGDDVIPSNGGSVVSLALAALLPAVAVLSFVAGSKWAKTAQPTMRDVEDRTGVD